MLLRLCGTKNNNKKLFGAVSEAFKQRFALSPNTLECLADLGLF
jgi:hypothetical protein